MKVDDSQRLVKYSFHREHRKKISQRYEYEYNMNFLDEDFAKKVLNETH